MFTEEQFGNGAVDRPDDYFGTRSWRHEEIAGASEPAIWKEKAISEFVTYPKRNQGTQSSCVSYVLAKQLAVDELQENGLWRELSPRSLYAYTRVAGGGSSSLVATKLACKLGMTLEHLFKTDGLSEEEVATDKGFTKDAKQIGFVYKPQSFVESASDFNTIASIIHNHRLQGIKKGVAITIIGQNNGSWLSTFPKIPSSNSLSPWYHRVFVTDFGLIKGKKYLSIDNSWGENSGNKGQQFLGQDYEPYMYGAIYTLDQKDDWQQDNNKPQPPSYKWYVDLKYGSTGQDVVMLQAALQSMGMFPIATVIKLTGNFFGITQKAVELFQAAMFVPVTGVVDAATRDKLNTIFGT